MVSGKKAGLMEPNMRDNMTKGGSMGEGNQFSPRKVTMRVNLTKMRYVAKESTTGRMGNNTLGSGLKIKCMATALLSGLMGAHMREILFKTSEMETAV